MAIGSSVRKTALVAAALLTLTAATPHLSFSQNPFKRQYYGSNYFRGKERQNRRDCSPWGGAKLFEASAGIANGSTFFKHALGKPQAVISSQTGQFAELKYLGKAWFASDVAIVFQHHIAQPTVAGVQPNAISEFSCAFSAVVLRANSYSISAGSIFGGHGADPFLQVAFYEGKRRASLVLMPTGGTLKESMNILGAASAGYIFSLGRRISLELDGTLRVASLPCQDTVFSMLWANDSKLNEFDYSKMGGLTLAYPGAKATVRAGNFKGSISIDVWVLGFGSIVPGSRALYLGASGSSVSVSYAFN